MSNECPVKTQLVVALNNDTGHGPKLNNCLILLRQAHAFLQSFFYKEIRTKIKSDVIFYNNYDASLSISFNTKIPIRKVI